MYTFTREGAQSLGYDCGFYYIVGGRPPLNTQQRQSFAAHVATGQCTTSEQTTAFIDNFVQGYTDREQGIVNRKAGK